PTHFLPNRRYGMFIVAVPKNFTPQDKFTWTLTVNGQVTSIPLRLNPDYVISPFSEIAVNNTPPVLRFDQNGPAILDPLARPEVEKLPAAGDAAFSGKATTNVKFSEPGDYVLHVTVNDYSGDGGGGFQCCWTTGLVKVSVSR